MTLVEDGKI